MFLEFRCYNVIAKQNLSFSQLRGVFLSYGKNTYAPFFCILSIDYVTDFVWQQLELCVFRASAPVGAFFNIKKIFVNMIHKIKNALIYIFSKLIAPHVAEFSA